MFRWLSRYVKQINVLGVGIEFREITAEEALPLLPTRPQSAPAQPSAETSALELDHAIDVWVVFEQRRPLGSDGPGDVRSGQAVLQAGDGAQMALPT